MIRLGRTLLVVFLLTSCGAPLKKSEDVVDIFGDSAQLFQKMGDLCSVLRVRNAQPNLSGVTFANEMCATPASQVQNFRDVQGGQEFAFAETRSGSNAADSANKLFNLNTRSQLWLNISLIQMAQIAFSKFEEDSRSIFNAGGRGSSKSRDFDFQIKGQPHFNKETFDFNLEFNITSKKAQNGKIDMNNDFVVNGAMINKRYIAATAITKIPAKVEQSILKEGKFIILVIPHAGDVYLEVATDLKFHSFGADEEMKNQILAALGPGLKSIPELFAALKN